MRHSTLLALASAASLSTASPLESRAVAKFPAGTTWDIVLKVVLPLADLQKTKVQALDIDLFDNTEGGKTTIKELAKTKQVICYFSAGSREDWRDDANQFVPADYGKALDGWEGENWLDVKSANVRKIMKARIEFAAKSGCTAVDPDNTDGFSEGQDGFGYPKEVYADYVNYLAGIAKTNNLAIGLKNSLDIIPLVLPNIQFAVNEQCHEFENECALYKPVTAAGLAVFQIEYGGNNCTEPAGVNLSEVIKGADQQLDKLGGQCP
ncbi:glycoside hydrolase family 114 protein [Melanomma pulvis-pyrius CBS 109.77]|uniref:alpha-galactosidase n=1 Tax=Melanomma pulvis-pyrius CBS 109.77 TaxID=1314802 RepID=A0A6A6XTK6_9PLEO|nr:glycoside hydrolase family 114 protein [Melanomma pulvis-pyrius CBS 109.77]